MPVKIVFKGTEVRTNKPFCIIKEGSYPLTKEGLLSALSSGYTDKTGEFAPEFSFSAFSTDKRIHGKFHCKINELNYTGKKVQKTYKVSIRCVEK